MKYTNSKKIIFGGLYSILPGVASALFCIFILTGFSQLLIAYLFGVEVTHFTFNYFSLQPVINPLTQATVIAYVFVYLSPLFFNIFLIEIGTSLLRKTNVGNKRFSLIIFNLLITGYLIIYVFVGAIISQLSPESSNDLNQLLLHINASDTGKIIFMIAVILIFTIYLKQTSKRILEYIN